MTIATALRALGKTEKEVAETLRRAGVRGAPMKPCGCPVAIWLTAQCGEATRVSVPPWHPSRPSRLHANDIPLPPPVARFVEAFDRGYYPDLCLALEVRT